MPYFLVNGMTMTPNITVMASPPHLYEVHLVLEPCLLLHASQSNDAHPHADPSPTRRQRGALPAAPQLLAGPQSAAGSSGATTSVDPRRLPASADRRGHGATDRMRSITRLRHHAHTSRPEEKHILKCTSWKSTCPQCRDHTATNGYEVRMNRLRESSPSCPLVEVW